MPAGGTLIPCPLTERWWNVSGPLVARWWNAGGPLVALFDITNNGLELEMVMSVLDALSAD